MSHTNQRNVTEKRNEEAVELAKKKRDESEGKDQRKTWRTTWRVERKKIKAG